MTVRAYLSDTQLYVEIEMPFVPRKGDVIRLKEDYPVHVVDNPWYNTEDEFVGTWVSLTQSGHHLENQEREHMDLAWLGFTEE